MAEQLYRSDKLYIGGEWVDPIDGEVAPSIDPSTGEAWAMAAFGGAKDIDRAVAAAREALDGPWRRMTVTERANILRRVATLYAAESGRLAELESRDNGMAIRDTRASAAAHPSWYNYHASLAETLEGRQIPMDPSVHIYTTRNPIGVVGAILPWNAPLLNTSWKLGPSLATGCTIVIKPAEQTPVSTMELARILEQAGVPKGVVNIVPGLGPVAGARLVASPGVDKISFTGEHRTAQEIMKGAAATLKRLSFECGGKSPHILFDDCRLDQALNAATHSAFALCGQSCALGSRLLVQAGIYEQVVAEVARRAAAVRIGPALDPATQMGPQAHAEQLDKTMRYIGIGREEGARLVAGGARPSIEGRSGGYYVSPTVFADVDAGMRIAQEEIFGPVVSVIPFRDEDEAVAIANGTEYGLVAGVWTENLGRAHRVAGRIDAGTVWVNTYRYVRWNVPYGGFGISGIGRESGSSALDEYTETKAVVMSLTSEFPNPYAQ